MTAKPVSGLGSAGGPRGLAARLAGAALDALFPPRCLSCEAAVSAQGTLCPGCFGALRFVAGPVCRVCGVPGRAEGEVCGACRAAPPAYARARAPLLYDDASKRLILPFKHGDRTELAKPLSRLMAWAGSDLLAEAELLVPVPLHRWRLWHRRHNQAALLCAALAIRTGKPCHPDLLTRRRSTRPLGELGATERKNALAGAICVKTFQQRHVAGRVVLLVDDVMTSGATANACAVALIATGARAVHVLSAARVERSSL